MKTDAGVSENCVLSGAWERGIMSTTEISPVSSDRPEPKPMPENFRSVQPGGGVCYSLELAWGALRRRWLKLMKPGFVRWMAEVRKGTTEGAPHEILDPRDLKFCRNQCMCDWEEADDPFRWRERLPFARWGLAELQIMGWPLFALTIVPLVLLWPSYWCAVAIAPAVLSCLVVYFFRDPPRHVPQEAGLLVSPADGKIAEITELDHDEFIGGPAMRIGIFLSIFNVHINRAPEKSRVIELRYNPGLFLNALRPDSAWRNENTWIGLEEESPPYRKMIVRQISGQFARRIVCNLRPGETVSRGHKFGMIKLGSRTELILPKSDDLKIAVEVGQKVKAGTTIMARWKQ
jgi:phosphatidylserine decarboxylase